MAFDADAVARLLVAVALGAAVGIEREAADQPAGLRTHMAVALGAALFGVVSTLGFSEFVAERGTTNVNVDVTRVASQVVVGIGFLGAGMIFRQGTVVRNLTTAASLWATAAVGLTSGVGDMGTAAVATAILLASLALLRPLRGLVRRYLARDDRRLRIVLVAEADPAGVVGALHDLGGVDVGHLSIEKDEGAFVVVAELEAHPHVGLDERLASIARRDDVRSLGDS